MSFYKLLEYLRSRLVDKTDALHRVFIHPPEQLELDDGDKYIIVTMENSTIDHIDASVATYREGISIQMHLVCRDIEDTDTLFQQVMPLLTSDYRLGGLVESFVWSGATLHYDHTASPRHAVRQVEFDAAIVHDFPAQGDLTDLYGLDAEIEAQPDQGQRRLGVKVDY